MTALRGSELVAWIGGLPSEDRDRALDEHVGIGEATPPSTPPGEHLVGYHASGIEPVLEIVRETPIRESDVVVDLGAGLGRVALLVHLLTGARVRGIELQPDLVSRAIAAAKACKASGGVRFELGDVRTHDLDGGNVYFMYLPFTGPVLLEVLARLRTIAERRKIVVCTLGLDLDRLAPWLVRRPLESFWVAIYDSG